MAYINTEKLIKFIDERGQGLGITVANCCNFKDIVLMMPHEDVIPRTEVYNTIEPVEGMSLGDVLSNAHDELSRAYEFLIDNQDALDDMLLSDIEASLDRIGDILMALGEFTYEDAEKLLNESDGRHITIPEGYTSIGKSAFYWCNQLESVTIPEGVTTIKQNAFNGCTSLKQITIPASVTSIGNAAFCNCGALDNIEIPESVTFIGKDAFAGCTSLTSIKIPTVIKVIDEYAFYGCESLSNVSFAIPSNLTHIEPMAFSRCNSLENIALPATFNMDNMHETAFANSPTNFSFVDKEVGTTKYSDKTFGLADRMANARARSEAQDTSRDTPNKNDLTI